MNEHRKETRKKLMAFTPVYDPDRGILLGYLGDLTFKGAMVVGEKPLEVNSQATLEIEFHDDLPGISTRRMTIPARVVRCVQDAEGHREFDIGFEFTNIDAEHTKIIQALLERYHVHSQSE
jgi:hypothetical protein